MKKNAILLLLLLGSLFPVWGQSSITPEIIADLQGPRQVELSPDGKTIAFTYRIPGGEVDKPGKSWHEIHTISTDGENHKKYITKPMSAFRLTWSSDGKYLYFLSRRQEIDAHTQIYRIPLEGGEAELVSEHEGSIQAFQISPDGKNVAFKSKDIRSKEEKLAAQQGKDWIVYGQNYKYSRLYNLNLKSGNSKLIFNEDLEVADFVWTPDNRRLVFRASETPETDDTYMYQKIYQVGASGGTPSIVCTTAGKLGHLQVSPDGSTLAFAGAVDISDPLPQSLFTVPLGGGTPQNRTDGMEASVLGFTWTNDHQLLVHFAEKSYSSLYNLDTESGKRKMLYNQGIIFRSFSYVNGLLAVVGNSPQHPSEVLMAKLSNLKFKRLTRSNPILEKIDLAEQKLISWNGPKGIQIEGILTLPLGYQAGKKYPLLLQIHGGPEGISYHGWNTRGVYPVQYYAAKGFLVLEPNYRGSQGRGVEFAKADHKDLAGDEFEDVLAGVDHLISEGMADPDKVVTGGFSYGGYFSAWAATKHSNRFKAAMVGAGITNWISFSGTTDIIHENSLVHWNLWWYDQMELVWDRSPLAHINNCETPILVVHGEKDVRVPLGQGQEIYHALRLKGIDTEMVVYRRQPHGIRERAAAIDYMERTLKWYQKYTR